MRVLKGLFALGNRVHNDHRGIQSLETAIMLCMFVVVASVLAFAVLTTGLAGAQKSQDVALEVLADSSATMALRGAVVGIANPAGTALDSVRLTLSAGGRSAQSADLSNESTIITYMDDAQAMNMDPSQWSTAWLIGSGPLLDAGEAVEVQVNLTALSPVLGTQREFFLRIRPEASPVLLLQRTTPREFTGVVALNRGFAGPEPVKPTITPLPPTPEPK